jgi:hypothetical protein
MVSVPRSLSSVFSGDFGISIPAAGRCSPSWQQSPSDVVCGARRRRIGHCVGDLHYRHLIGHFSGGFVVSPAPLVDVLKVVEAAAAPAGSHLALGFTVASGGAR